MQWNGYFCLSLSSHQFYFSLEQPKWLLGDVTPVARPYELLAGCWLPWRWFVPYVFGKYWAEAFDEGKENLGRMVRRDVGLVTDQKVLKMVQVGNTTLRFLQEGYVPRADWSQQTITIEYELKIRYAKSNHSFLWRDAEVNGRSRSRGCAQHWPMLLVVEAS